MKRYFWWIFITASAFIITWLLTTVWFPNANFLVLDFPNSRVNHIKQNRQLIDNNGFAWINNDLYIKSTSTDSGLKRITFDGQPKEIHTATTSPDQNKIIFSSLYNGYGDGTKPASTLTVIDIQTGQILHTIKFFPELISNTDRFISRIEWIDNRYVVIYGDSRLAIIDTDKEKLLADLMASDYLVSPDKTQVAFPGVIYPMYGPSSVHNSTGAGIVDLSSGNVQYLKQFNSSDVRLYWSPDSQLLAIEVFDIDGHSPMTTTHVWVGKTSGQGLQEIVLQNLNQRFSTHFQKWANNTTVVITSTILTASNLEEYLTYAFSYSTKQLKLVSDNTDGGIKNPDAASVLQFIYGNYDPIAKTAQWTITHDDVNASIKNNVFDLEAFTSVGREYTVSSYLSTLAPGGDFLVLTKTLPTPQNSCHACSAIIGAFDFYKSGGSWVPKITERAFTEMGPWGEAPNSISIVKYGQNDYAFKIEESDMHFGFSDSGIALVAPIQDHFVTIFIDGDISASNNGADDGTPVYAYSSTMKFFPVQGFKYYDIQITTSGTRLNPQKQLQSFNEKHLFKFSNGAYVESN